MMRAVREEGTSMGKPSILAGLLGLSGLAPQPYPPPFPREGAIKLLENERVVVWDVSWEKGKPTPMHEHRLELAGVFLADGAVKITEAGGAERMSDRSPVGTVTYGERGVLHREEGMSDTPRRAVIVELKDFTPAPLDERPPGVAPAFPREGARRLLDNRRLSVWDYQWVPGRPVPLHFHDKDTVVVFLEPGRLRSTPPGGEPVESARRFAEVLFNRRNRSHSEESVEGTPRAIVFELK
jgi:quercetin dioxygenase-like cupin family protein